MLTRRKFVKFSAALPALGLLSRPAFAAKPEIYASGGVAINGYDAVAYFQEAAPVPGDAAYTVEWKGVIWQFSRAENRDAFAAAPDDFAPQYGGYCAYALSKGAIAKTSPDAWTVHGGKLYLNYDVSVRSIWQQDIPGNISLADENWPAVLSA
ncbi:YHS domain-containing (seleno)protein [uncultured Roseovarius sp.]|uniref:YHS domain-containing (seleno)protein n=1 Tax=uncultured Roseovarius sp. TaxID=293344 RepID=UPI0026066992|nr:YHS domain-containing (seleno)protein [uncultured Roseovarius sp.]